MRPCAANQLPSSLLDESPELLAWVRMFCRPGVEAEPVLLLLVPSLQKSPR